MDSAQLQALKESLFKLYDGVIPKLSTLTGNEVATTLDFLKQKTTEILMEAEIPFVERVSVSEESYESDYLDFQLAQFDLAGVPKVKISSSDHEKLEFLERKIQKHLSASKMENEFQTMSMEKYEYYRKEKLDLLQKIQKRNYNPSGSSSSSGTHKRHHLHANL